MSCRLTKAGLMKFPVHPESIKALADALPICTHTTKLLAYRALLAAIRCGPGRSFQGLPFGGSPSFPIAVFACDTLLVERRSLLVLLQVVGPVPVVVFGAGIRPFVLQSFLVLLQVVEFVLE